MDVRRDQPQLRHLDAVVCEIDGRAGAVLAAAAEGFFDQLGLLFGGMEAEFDDGVLSFLFARH